MAKGVLIQASFYESMKVLPDSERLLLYDCLCEYSLNGKEPGELPPIANSLFILMKPNIDSSNRRYKASVENGKKGGAPKGNQNAKKQPKNNQSKQPKNKQDYDLDYDLDLDLDKDLDKDCNSTEKKQKRSLFKPPTIEEVKAYCKERNNNVDAQRFVDFYEAKGWMLGKNKMKDWKAAVRTWERNETNGQASRDNAENQRYGNYI